MDTQQQHDPATPIGMDWEKLVADKQLLLTQSLPSTGATWDPPVKRGTTKYMLFFSDNKIVLII